MVIEVACSTKNGDRHFSKLFNVEETKDIIHSRSYPVRDVVQSVSYNISALIRCNFIITNYVNRKITSYIYLLIFTIYLWLHVKHYIELTKRASVRRIFFVITGLDYPCQHIDQWPRKTRESTTALATKIKIGCVRIKRVKTDSYWAYGHSRKAWNYTKIPPFNDGSRFQSCDVPFCERKGDCAVVNVNQHCNKMSKSI